MLKDAVNKISTEINGEDDPYVKLIGEFLIQHITARPEHAGYILTEGKTVAKSLDAMADEARKKAKNNRAVLTDAEGYAIVLKYFGIEGQTQGMTASRAVGSDFDIKLDDLV